MTSAVNASLETDTDLNLGILNIRVDSTTHSVQMSTTGPSVDILYNVKIYDTSNHSSSVSSGSQTGLSTTPVNFYNSIVNVLNQFVEIHIINLSYATSYTAYVACNDDVTPMYVAILSKTS